MTETKNLELNLIKETELTATSGNPPYMVLGKLKEKVYNSELGLIRIHELYDKKGNTEKYILTNSVNWEKIKEKERNFYGEKIKAVLMFSEEEVEKLFEPSEGKFKYHGVV